MRFGLYLVLALALATFAAAPVNSASNQTNITCAVSPSSATVLANTTANFSVTCMNAGNPVPCPLMQWSSNVGTVNPTYGNYTVFRAVYGNFNGTVNASANGTLSCSASVRVLTNIYYLNLAADPSNAGSVIGGGSYSQYQIAQISAYPNTGYRFLYWYATQGDCPINSTHSPNATVMMNPSSGNTCRFTAFFELNQTNITYYLNLSVDPQNSGLVYGGGIYPYNYSVQISAYPNTGYRFVGWYGTYGNCPINSTNSSSAVVRIRPNPGYTCGFVAAFELNTTNYGSLIATAVPSNGGSAYGTAYNFTVPATRSISAVPDS